MEGKPLISIDKFSEMSSGGGIYNLDGFSIENENGINFLKENFETIEKVTKATTNFSNLGDVKSILYVIPLNGSFTNDPYAIYLDSVGKFYTKPNSSGVYSGEINSVIVGGSLLASSYPDMITLTSGNILFTSRNHIGLIIRGLAKTGSGTTKIIDKAGRNLGTLGASSSSPNNTVVNLRTGVKYTISSVSTTSSTNDTINFSSVGSNDNLENDEYLIFVQNKFDLTSGITYPTFSGQPTTEYWARQIKQYRDTWYISNGNYLAKLSSDESTFANNFKQMLIGHQITSFDVNNSKLLISTIDSNGVSHLILWDGFNAFDKDQVLDRPVYCVKKYNSGWVYVARGSVFFTDGSQIITLGTHPDEIQTVQNYLTPSYFNQIEVLDNQIYIVNDKGNLNRIKKGLYVFTPKVGFTYVKVRGSLLSRNNPVSIFINPSWNNNILSPGIEIGASSAVCSMRNNQPCISTRDTKSFIYLLNLKEPIQVKEIKLNISPNLNQYFDIYGLSDITADIYLNIADGKKPITMFNQAGSIYLESEVKVNGSLRPGVIGQEIEFIDGDIAGERTYITDIYNSGLTTEGWVVSPVLSKSGATNVNMNVFNFKKVGNKTIKVSDLNEPIRFTDVNFYGNKLYLEVVVKGSSVSFPICIFNIELY